MTVPPESLPPPDRSAEEIRSAAEEILARPEFTSGESLYDRIVGWLNDRLNEVLSALTGGGRGALIAWAMLAVALAAVGYLVWRIVRDGAVRAARRAQPGATVTVAAARRPSSHWRGEADRHAAAGRWRDAVRCRWRALVAELVERGRIEDADGMTAGDYRRAVTAAAPPAGSPFADATDLFESAWYGGAVVGPADHERMVGVIATVVDATNPTGPSGAGDDDVASAAPGGQGQGR